MNHVYSLHNGFSGTFGSIYESPCSSSRNKGIYVCKSSKLSDGASDAGSNKRNEISEYKRLVHRESTKELYERGETVYYRCR